jgi:hypothetical protein
MDLDDIEEEVPVRDLTLPQCSSYLRLLAPSMSTNIYSTAKRDAVGTSSKDRRKPVVNLVQSLDSTSLGNQKLANGNYKYTAVFLESIVFS